MRGGVNLVDEEELKGRIASFPRWHYQFDLAGVKTPIFDRAHINRHEQRSSYFFDALLSLTGGTLRGKRVLDLGCNAGFWSLKAVEAGCDFVYGVDGRQMHIDQASLVFEVKGVDPSRYEFAVGNVFFCDLSAQGPFDVVLCLGLLYHVSKPVELLERISEVNSDLLVIDTDVSSRSGSHFEVRHESLDEPRNAVDYEIVLCPTRRAVLELANQFGYRAIPLALDTSNFDGMLEYLIGERVAFICAKTSSLAGLRAGPVEPPFVRSEQAAREGLRFARWTLSCANLLGRKGGGAGWSQILDQARRRMRRRGSPPAVEGTTP